MYIHEDYVFKHTKTMVFEVESDRLQGDVVKVTVLISVDGDQVSHMIKSVVDWDGLDIGLLVGDDIDVVDKTNRALIDFYSESGSRIREPYLMRISGDRSW